MFQKLKNFWENQISTKSLPPLTMEQRIYKSQQATTIAGGAVSVAMGVLSAASGVYGLVQLRNLRMGK